MENIVRYFDSILLWPHLDTTIILFSAFSLMAFILIGVEIFECGCGSTITPFFAKKHRIPSSVSCWGDYKAYECRKCHALWLPEDGYWSLLTKEKVKRMLGLKEEIEEAKASFKPDFTGNELKSVLFKR